MATIPRKGRQPPRTQRHRFSPPGMLCRVPSGWRIDWHLTLALLVAVAVLSTVNSVRRPTSARGPRETRLSYHLRSCPICSQADPEMPSVGLSCPDLLPMLNDIARLAVSEERGKGFLIGRECPTELRDPLLLSFDRESIPSTLRVAGSTNRGTTLDEAVDEVSLMPFVTEALAPWRQAGVNVSRLQHIQQYSVRVADAPGLLGMTSQLARTIWIDRDASGQGPYFDPMPATWEEFCPGPRRPEGVDLLSVVTHEFGHPLGLRTGWLAWSSQLSRGSWGTSSRCSMSIKRPRLASFTTSFQSSVSSAVKTSSSRAGSVIHDSSASSASSWPGPQPA